MPGKTPTTMEYALLGLVGMAPMSGYDVHKVFETTPLAHFSSSPGAIYPALGRLERQGLLKSVVDSKKKMRPRRVYSLTKSGEAALQAWVREHVTREELVRSEGASILRFSVAQGRLSRREVLAYLDGYRRAVESYLEELRGYLPDVRRSQALHARLALQRGIAGYESDVEWIERAAAEIRRAGRGARKRRAPR